MSISLLNCDNFLMRVCFKQAYLQALPANKNFPIVFVDSSKLTTHKDKTGELLLERPGVNAEFLPDFLKEEGLFLQKMRIQRFFNGRAAVLMEYGRKEKKVRNIRFIRELQGMILGEAVWGLRIYKNPESEPFPICFNFACRRPYFALSGEPLDVRPEFVIQKQDGLVVLTPTSQQHTSAA